MTNWLEFARAVERHQWSYEDGPLAVCSCGAVSEAYDIDHQTIHTYEAAWRAL